jgi:hypothetical protein
MADLHRRTCRIHHLHIILRTMPMVWECTILTLIMDIHHHHRRNIMVIIRTDIRILRTEWDLP